MATKYYRYKNDFVFYLRVLSDMFNDTPARKPIGYWEGSVLFNDALNTFSYGYMASDIWLRTRHMGYSFRLAASVLLYAPSHRQDSTYHGLCYTSRGTLTGTRNSSMSPPWRIDPTTHRTMSERSYHGATGYWVSEQGRCIYWLSNKKIIKQQPQCKELCNK